MGKTAPSRPPLIDAKQFRNIGVLQTTVAELVTVKEHQRTCPLHSLLQKSPLT